MLGERRQPADVRSAVSFKSRYGERMSDRSIGSEFKISVLFGLAVCLTTGCGDKSGNVSLSPVTGTVVYKGQPIERGTIVFYPESGRSAAGVITDGEIAEVMTYEPGDGAREGRSR